jgi:hypothetical protein
MVYLVVADEARRVFVESKVNALRRARPNRRAVLPWVYVRGQ